MKKVLKKLIFLSMTSLLLTSCGGNGGQTSSTSTSTPSPVDPYLEEYYSPVEDWMSGQTLIDTLYDIIHPAKCTGTYDGIWNIIRFSDAAHPEDPNDDHEIIGFYRGYSGQRTEMNKEHVWPKSRGGHAIDGDPHMVRPTFTADNTGRGNDFYNAAPLSYDPAELGAPQYRGIAARIIFYCAVQEKNALRLVDKTTDSTISTVTGTMGKLSTLLQWNLQYSIDWSELLRNEVLNGRWLSHNRTFNFNRNPFIDHPEYACRIWGSTNSETRRICGM